MAYPILADPTRMNAVPSKAVRARKMKKEAKFGARAVPRLEAQKRMVVSWVICEGCPVSVSLAVASWSSHTGLESTYRFSATNLAERAPYQCRHSHGEHIQSVGQVDDAAIGSELCCHFRGSGKNGSAGDGGEKGAKTEQGDNGKLAVWWELVVYGIRQVGQAGASTIVRENCRAPYVLCLEVLASDRRERP